MKIISFIIMLILFISCNKKKYFDGPNEFQENFEDYEQIEDIIIEDNKKWSFIQKTYDENQMTIDTVIFHSGGKSFKSFAAKGTEEKGASKASINKQFMAFWQGETVVIEAWYYIVGQQEANWLFLMDLEEKATIGAGPGMRIGILDNKLALDHKYPNPNLKQTPGNEIDFPRDKWVKIRLEVLLSQKKEGTIKIWQDDDIVINQDKWQTLPKDVLYFIQGTKGMYDKIEFGVTANSRDNPSTVYVDDIKVEIIE